MNWYALKSRDELLTADMLRQANYLAYVPCETVKRERGRLKGLMSRPLFPGYVFVNCSSEGFSAVRAIGAADDFVRFTNPAGDRVPLRLPAGALLPIIWAEIAGEFDRTKTPPPWNPTRHDAVRITRTMWQGYLGQIVSIGNRKITVDLGKFRKEFTFDDLELVA